MAGLKYLLWLATRHGLPPQRGAELLEYFGTAEAAYFAGPEEYDGLRLPPLLRQSLQDKRLDGAEVILDRCSQLGVRILTCVDAGYPERLLQLRDYPLVLYTLGRSIHFDEELAVAIVGARKCTPYGVGMAEEIAAGLARAGALVISGIAQGIDSAAVGAALRAGGTAVSVLACGLDVCYPPSSRRLYQDLAAAGTLISEHPPGTPILRGCFPVRNRIISGLSVGVTAVEACAGRSGTLITSLLALDQGRDLFAVPGPANAPMSAGTNGLIARGEAKLVRDAGDILEEYRGRFSLRPRRPAAPAWREPEPRPAPAAPVEREVTPPEQEKPPVEELPLLPQERWRAMADQEREILTCLTGACLTADQLLERLDMNARQVNTSLTVLHSQGILRELPGRRFQAAVRLK